MNSEDVAQFRSFVREVVDAGQEVTQMSHVAEPVKAVIRDFLKICQNINLLIDNQSGQTADGRILKKKLEQFKSDFYLAEKKVEKMQQLILSVLEDFQDITIAVEHILKDTNSQPNTVTHINAKKIQQTIETKSKRIMEFKV